jgi:hypothetical protein
MANVKISQLTAKGAHVEATDRIPIADFNGSTYDTKYITGEQLTPYKKYVATVKQTGTSNPVVTVLENTIGTIVWTRDGVGQYIGTLSTAFPTDTKTFTLVGKSNQNFFDLFRLNNDEVALLSADTTNTLDDELLQDTAIEIRVYP